jgi:Cu/Ag efflux protein CusF
MEESAMLARKYVLGLLAPMLIACSVHAEELRGVVIKADPSRKIFTIETRGGKRVRGRVITFLVGNDTQILRGKDTAALADLSAGERVRVTFEDRGNGPVALMVRMHEPLSSILSAPGAAPAPNGPPPPQPLPADGANTVSGVARRVALTDREIVVVRSDGKSGEMETTIEVPADAKITRDQKPARLEDIKEGQTISVQTQHKNGKVLAQSIEVGATRAAAAPPAAANPDRARVQRLRMILKMVDFYLQQMDRQ